MLFVIVDIGYGKGVQLNCQTLMRKFLSLFYFETGLKTLETERRIHSCYMEVQLKSKVKISVSEH